MGSRSYYLFTNESAIKLDFSRFHITKEVSIELDNNKTTINSIDLEKKLEDLLKFIKRKNEK
jgi:hypothetical protein